MPLINFSLTAPKISPGILLSCLETVIPENKIAQAIAETKAQQQRNRRGAYSYCNIVNNSYEFLG